MPSLPFKPKLITSVMSGTKPGTVREVRKKHPIKPGDTLYLFTGMRTNKCKRHGQHVCVATYEVFIDCEKKTIEINGVELPSLVRHWFATTDIQGTEDDFFDFFKAQKYLRPLVYIVWNFDVAKMLNEFLCDQSRVLTNFSKKVNS